MTKEELERLRELNDILMRATGEEFKIAYAEYEQLIFKRDKEYRKQNEAEITLYFKENIEGKRLEDIDQGRWDFYSDWHKDVFGYRPRSISINERGV